MARHAAAAPALAVLRRLDDFGEHAARFLGIERRGAPRSRGFLEAGQAQVHKALPPQADGHATGLEFLRDARIVEPSRCLENNLGAQHYFLRRGGRSGQPLQFALLFRVKEKIEFRTRHAERSGMTPLHS